MPESVVGILASTRYKRTSGAICTGFSCAFVYGPSLVLLFWKKKNKTKSERQGERAKNERNQGQ